MGSTLHVAGVTGDVAAIELYDQHIDSDENTNTAELDENKKLVKQLAKRLQRGWQAAIPAR